MGPRKVCEDGDASESTRTTSLPPSSTTRTRSPTTSTAPSTSVALLTIEAGYHYATDVAAGALLDSAMGLLVPVVHAEW